MVLRYEGTQNIVVCGEELEPGKNIVQKEFFDKVKKDVWGKRLLSSKLLTIEKTKKKEESDSE